MKGRPSFDFDTMVSSIGPLCTEARGHHGPHKHNVALAGEQRDGTRFCCAMLHARYRQRTACPGCGFVAMRTVSDNGKWVSHCTACTKLNAANDHEHQARKLRQQAADIFGKRAAREREEGNRR